MNSLFIKTNRPRHLGEMPGLCVPNVPSVGPLGHQEGPTVSRWPKKPRADTKPWFGCPGSTKSTARTPFCALGAPPCTVEPLFVHGRPILDAPCTVEPLFVHGRPILDAPCTVEPLFVHGRPNRRDFGAKPPARSDEWGFEGAQSLQCPMGSCEAAGD